MNPLTEEQRLPLQLVITLQLQGIAEEEMPAHHAEAIRQNLKLDDSSEGMSAEEIDAAILQTAADFVAEGLAARDEIIAQVFQLTMEGRDQDEIAAAVVAATGLSTEIAQGMATGADKGVRAGISESVAAGVARAFERLDGEGVRTRGGWRFALGRIKAVAILVAAVGIFSSGAGYLAPQDSYYVLAVLEPVFDAFGHQGLAFAMMGLAALIALYGRRTWQRAGYEAV